MLVSLTSMNFDKCVLMPVETTQQLRCERSHHLRKTPHSPFPDTSLLLFLDKHCCDFFILLRLLLLHINGALQHLLFGVLLLLLKMMVLGCNHAVACIISLISSIKY